MDKIISQYDYAKGDEATEQDLSSDLQDCTSKFAETMTTDEMNKIINVFINKICIRPFPERMSKPYWMCYTTINAIGDVLIECEDIKRLTREQCQGHLLDLMLALITKGQGSTHFTLISRIFDFMDMDKYLEEMKGPQIFKVLDAIKQQEYVEEKETDIKDYGSYYNDAVGFIFERVLGERDCTKHLEPDIHTAVLDLYMFLLVRITENQEELVESITYVRNHVWYRYDHKPYKGCKDSKLMKNHLGIIKKIISKQGFPRFEEEIKQVTDTFEYILSGIVLDSDMIREMWCDIAEFVKYLCQMSNNSRFLNMLSQYKSFMIDIPDETIAENPDLFPYWAKTMTTILLECKDTDTEVLKSFIPKSVQKVVEKSKPKSDYDMYIIPLLNGMLKFPDNGIASAAEFIIKHSKYKKIWSWKKNVEGARMIINTIKEAKLPTEGRQRYKQSLWLVKVHFEVMPEFIELYITSLEKKSQLISEFLTCVIKSLNLKKHTTLIPDILKRFDVLYKDADYPWMEAWCSSCGDNLLEATIKAYKDGSEIPEDVNKILISIFLFAMDENTERIDYENRMLNFYGATIVGPLREFASKHNDGDTMEVVNPLIPSLFKMLEDDSENLQETSSYILFGIIAMKSPQLLASDEYVHKILHYYLNENQEYEVLDAIHHIYPLNPDPINKRFQDIFSMFGQNTVMDNGFLHFFQQVVEIHPQVFTKENVNKFKYHMTDPQLSFFVLSILEKISIKQTDILEDMATYVIGLDSVPPHTCVWIKDMLSRVAVNNEKFLAPVLQYFIQRTQGDEHETQYLGFYDGMRKLSHKYGSDPFKPYREYLDDQKVNGSANVKSCVTTLIDELEGRSLETFEKELEQQKEDIENLDDRMTGAELVVGGVIKQVERHEDEIKEVKGDVDKVNTRVDVVEGDLSDIKEQVEEIDMKTISNAPKWSRDVTKLLNPESDHDWRLLASRLGYSNDDIRAWATQSDPCMALLTEWYATHNTKEATSGVLNILQEMNRLDAAVIVENALKAAEDVVEDEDFEYPSPPPVFLSYQWGHQNEVKLLRQHLQMAGYECWMDVGQMGGGDKLFEKIDSGVRGAKVVICCVSEKYAKSPNCNREVNLAVNLRKPMIPLQMEKIAWPPKGSMGPIFSEYLYIRFYSGGTGGKYWADSKFQELLMQLQFNNLIPDEKLITQEYTNWWIPVAEEIILKKDEKSNSQKVTNVKKENISEQENRSPDVFLSYQWGKQKQIQALYQRLTNLGFHCWMDIHQMGGGDSLYDKIDRGVRGCKVVVSSITQKYALSANCRREVSLADALKKPIIPLLLEDISWPPSGPMSMVLTQLLYINFSKDPDIQTKWSGKEFEELLLKLKQNVQEVSEEGTTQKETDKAKSKEQSMTSDKDQKDSRSEPKTTDKSSQSISEDKSSHNRGDNTSNRRDNANGKTTPPPKKKSSFCTLL